MFFSAITLCAVTSTALAMEKSADISDLEHVVGEGFAPIRDAIVRNLDIHDLSHLNLVSKSNYNSLNPAIDEIMTKRAQYLSNVSSAVKLDFFLHARDDFEQ